jgi:hypothetical protein
MRSKKCKHHSCLYPPRVSMPAINTKHDNIITVLTKQSMWQNLSQIFRSLSHDPTIRAIILSGAGDRAFTAGLDVQVPSLPLLSYPSTPILPYLTSIRPPQKEARSPKPPGKTLREKPQRCVGTFSISKPASPQSKRVRNVRPPSSPLPSAFPFPSTASQLILPQPSFAFYTEHPMAWPWTSL